jgi:hypothetical protein
VLRFQAIFRKTWQDPDRLPLFERSPLAFYETVMVKAFGTLVDSGTRVEVNTGMIAAARL